VLDKRKARVAVMAALACFVLWFGMLVGRCLRNRLRFRSETLNQHGVWQEYLTRNLLVSTSPAGEAVCRAVARP